MRECQIFTSHVHKKKCQAHVTTSSYLALGTSYAWNFQFYETYLSSMQVFDLLFQMLPSLLLSGCESDRNPLQKYNRGKHNISYWPVEEIEQHLHKK